MKRSPLQTAIADYVDAYFRFRPGEATEKGYARYDARSPSYAAEDIAEFRTAVNTARAAVRDLDPGALGSNEAVDLAAFQAHLATALFDIDRLGTFTNNPLAYVLSGLDSVEALELQGKRSSALANRLHGIPRLLEQAKARVEAPVEPFREVAIEMLASGIDHLGALYSKAHFGTEINEAALVARRAMDDYLSHLERRASDTRPFSPMGEEAYLFLLSHEHLLSDGLAPITALAHATLAEVTAMLAELGGDDDEDGDPEDPIPDGFGWRDVLAYYREELKAVRKFVADRQLISLPRGKIILKETPEYLRALIPGVCYLPPPAFSRVRRGHLFVRPVPREMDDEDRREYYDRVRYRSFRNTIAHEVWPGHHVQLLRAAAHPSPIRKFRDNDVMVEGWGLYSESVVREQGLWEGAMPEGSFRALRFRAARVIVDVGIHTGKLTLKGAVDWMCEQFGEGARRWVATEVRRYAAEPTQAMSYLVGQKLIHDLRNEWRDLVGRDAFELKRFHDAFIAEGSLPIPLIRRKMLERASRRRRSVNVGLGPVWK